LELESEVRESPLGVKLLPVPQQVTRSATKIIANSSMQNGHSHHGEKPLLRH